MDWMKAQKVFVSTHARYLEDDQKMSTSGSSQMELEENESFSSYQSDPIKEPSEA
jgi:hypothetical protein